MLLWKEWGEVATQQNFYEAATGPCFFCLLEGGAAERVSRTNALREMRSLLGHGNLIRFLGPSVEFP